MSDLRLRALIRCQAIHDYPAYPRGLDIRALVTCGAGFIGSQVVDRLLEEGHKAAPAGASANTA